MTHIGWDETANPRLDGDISGHALNCEVQDPDLRPKDSKLCKGGAVTHAVNSKDQAIQELSPVRELRQCVGF